MTPPRILIITNGPLSRNPRVWKEAQTLGASGMLVHVLGVRHRADAEDYDHQLMKSAAFTRTVVDLGKVASGQWRPFWRRLRTRLGGEMVQRLAWHTAWALPASAALLARARTMPADLVIVHNEAPHWVGWQLLREGRKVAADIEDWHSEDLLPEDSIRRPLRLLRQQEKALLHHAAYCTTTSNALADALHARYGGKRAEVVSNSFPLQPAPVNQPRPDVPSFFWFSQTIGPGRGLELFLKAWGNTQVPSRLVLQGECDPVFKGLLLSLLPADKIPHLHFLPLVEPHLLPASIASHDIGLALEQAFIPNRDLTITNKILQYLNAGLFILATDTQGQREVLRHSSAAGEIISLQDAQHLARDLDNLLSDRNTLGEGRRAAHALARSTYCWERETGPMIDRVHRVLSMRD